jgi:Gpi18-like mannosyltransferase
MSTSTLLNKNKEYYLYALVYVAMIMLAPHSGFGYDLWCWAEWSVYIHNHGLEDIYNMHTDYPPLYLYVLELFGWIKGNEHAIRESIFQLKYITLVFEFCSVFILFTYIQKSDRAWVFLFIVLNPGFFYNNIIWGQVDGILGFLLLSCIVLVLSRKNTLAILLFLISLNFKIQSIIFLPLLLFILIHNISDYKGLTHVLYVLLALAALQLLIISPYLSKASFEHLSNTMLQSVDKYPIVSMNAYNCWYWFWENKDVTKINDAGKWLAISYKIWGLLLFFISSVAALIPVFVTSIKDAVVKNKEPYKNIGQLFLSAGLIAVLFFFCNTQMHERYSHYGLIFLAAYFTVSGNYLPFLFMSIAYFLNMESVLKALQFPNYRIVLFNADFIAAIYFLLIIYLYFLIYKKSDLIGQIREALHALSKKQF